MTAFRECLGIIVLPLYCILIVIDYGCSSSSASFSAMNLSYSTGVTTLPSVLK